MTFADGIHSRPVGIYAVPLLALSQRSQLEHLIGLGGDLGTVRHDDHALALRMRQILEIPMMSSCVARSRLPVGSSAKIICGS